MIIDGHIFLGKSSYMEQTKETIIANMEKQGIDTSVVVAPPPGPYYDKANQTVAEATKNTKRLIPLYHANPFIEDIASAYRQADMVVSRAGATTLFELAAMGKPSILIPYPYATNGHQETNAQALARSGGAEMILQKDLTGEKLAHALSTYMENPRRLKGMGRAARTFSRPDADRIIVDHILKLTGRAET